MERRERQRIEKAETAEGRERQRNYSDFLDSLPDSLLIHILSYLPTGDSIITSTLSRRWRHLWTLIPFDFSKSNDLPTAVVVNLNQGSAVNTMDIHPSQQNLLLAGTNVGDITIWEVGRRERLVSRNFNVWDVKACSIALQALLASDYTASVNRVKWSPDGALFGVAYSKHIVQIYSYHGGNDLWNHLEIDAHVGKVSDLGFSYPNRQVCIITCGEDKIIKVWDAVTGNKLYTFEGREAPIYSVCPHHKENIQSISMGKSRLGYMIIWVQELTMMLQANLARQWPTVLTGQGYSHVGLVKKENHTLLNGMNVMGLSSVYIMVFGSGLWG